MNILRALRIGARPGGGDARADLHDKLPEVNAFVDLAVGGSLLRESVPINAITGESVIIRHPAGLEPGMTADFVYTNAAGRFRFATVCRKVAEKEAHLDLPAAIKTLELFADRRAAERVPWVIPVQWRYAPDDAGYGDFLPGSLMDLSRSGASLVVARELKCGTRVEVRFTLKSATQPFLELCVVVRAEKIEKSRKNAAGIAFLGLDPRDERVLVAFLNERQTRRRDRGVV